ncbi:hypothetical protein G7067_04035 [Leucobacter insecticola]|uniref:Uncharacterized protein n=1 Tax=Leucobacter insecticola TaxID=2714934 RepID=A0A6G8FHK7_9MICO|nr:hypothetical protein [Leucobacter insecticola]QIM15773.1 hypothetical protein G7067_04035 [Leucobacter insecticola]
MSSQQQETARSRRIPTSVKVVASIGSLLLLALAIITGSSAGTFALWNDNAAIPEASITVGNKQAGLSIAAGTQPGPKEQTAISFPASTWTNMLPGDIIRTPITITNLDSRSYELGADIDLPFSAYGDMRFALAEGTCTPGPLSGIELGAAPTDFGGPPMSGKTSKTFCLQVELSPTLAAAKQGTEITPTFTMTVYGY